MPNESTINETVNNVISEALKPIKERNKIIKNRKGDLIIPRRYYLSEDKAKQYIEYFQKNKIINNPFRKNGLYYSFIQALINLGINEKHSFCSVKNEMKNIMENSTMKKGTNLWSYFTNRKNNGKNCSWDINERIEHTARILQRIKSNHPHGYKLKQINCGIQIYKGEYNLPNYELKVFNNLEEVETINQFKKANKKITIYT